MAEGLIAATVIALLEKGVADRVVLVHLHKLLLRYEGLRRKVHKFKRGTAAKKAKSPIDIEEQLEKTKGDLKKMTEQKEQVVFMYEHYSQQGGIARMYRKENEKLKKENEKLRAELINQVGPGILIQDTEITEEDKPEITEQVIDIDDLLQQLESRKRASDLKWARIHEQRHEEERILKAEQEEERAKLIQEFVPQLKMKLGNTGPRQPDGGDFDEKDELEESDSGHHADFQESSASENSDTVDTEETKDDDFMHIDEKLCFSTELAEHIRFSAARSQLLEHLLELKNHPRSHDVYRIPVHRDLFGPRSYKLVLDVEETTKWIIQATVQTCKKWIEHNEIDIWASFLFSKMHEEDIGRIHFINTNSCNMNIDENVAQAIENLLEGLMKVFEDVKASLYAMPICRNQHWTMCFVVPNESTFYCIDSKGSIIHPVTRKFEHQMLMRIGAEYDKNIRKKAQVWTIKNILHKKQTGGWECGYYCMLYMEKIALRTNDYDVVKAFPEENDTYPSDIIEGLIDTYCRLTIKRIIPVCRQISHGPKKNAKEKSTQENSSP